MATDAQMEKKRSRQIEEILTATQKLAIAVGSMADELVRLKAEIADLKASIGPAQKIPAQMPTRKPKK